MNIRCKFTVTSRDPGPVPVNVVLTAQYDETIPEDQRYALATPSGQLSMYVTNAAALEHLVPGAVFYIDLVPANTGTSSSTADGAAPTAKPSRQSGKSKPAAAAEIDETPTSD